MVSEHTCPVRSISSAVFTDTILSFFMMLMGSFTYMMGRMSMMGFMLAKS